VKQILDNLLSLGRARLLILAGVGLGGVAALLFGLSVVTTPDYAMLYSQLSPASAASMVDALQKAGIPSEVSSDGSSVSVPRPDMARARMALAQKGLPQDGAPGWELFDKKSGFGMDTFMQKINRLRAMEGELARSIETLDGVQTARVHLVLPDRQAFSTHTPDPSASVIVRATANHSITRNQAVAIRNLIAAAVAGMTPNRVAVLSARGDTILAENAGDNAAGSGSLDGTSAAIEDRMAQNLQQILMARVGAGNARVQVTVQLDRSHQVVVQQSFNPDQQVVRSTSSRNDKSQNRQASGQVGVSANLPPALATPNTKNADTKSSASTNESTTYDIGNTRSETTTQAGAVKRLSVAVLVNGIYAKGKDGQYHYQPRSKQELAQLTDLVKSAIGYDKARGDKVTVESLRFMDYSMDLGAPAGPTLMQRLSNNVISILQWLIGLAIVAIAMIFGIRPVLSRIFDAPPALPSAEPPGALQGPEAAGEALGSDGAGALTAPEPQATVPSAMRTIPARSSGAVSQPVRMDAAAGGDFIEAISVQESALKRRVDAVRNFVDDDPNEAMKVLRGWLTHEVQAQ
jgi:flagellar M-ring protein FliF